MAVLWHSCSCVWFGKSCAKASQVCTRNSAHKGLTNGELFSLLAKRQWYRWKHKPGDERSLKIFLPESILIILLRFPPCKSWGSTQVLLHQCHLGCLGTPDTSIRLQETCTPLGAVQMGPGRWNWHKMAKVYLIDFCLYHLSVEYAVVVVRTRQRTEKFTLCILRMYRRLENGHHISATAANMKTHILHSILWVCLAAHGFFLLLWKCVLGPTWVVTWRRGSLSTSRHRYFVSKQMCRYMFALETGRCSFALWEGLINREMLRDVPWKQENHATKSDLVHLYS